MVWRHSGKVYDDEHGEYQGNNVHTYGYRDEEDEGHYAGIDHSRCCDWCDRLHETPARMGLTGQTRDFVGRRMVIANEIAIHEFEKTLKKEKENMLRDDRDDDEGGVDSITYL